MRCTQSQLEIREHLQKTILEPSNIKPTAAGHGLTMVKQQAVPRGSASLQTTMSGFLKDIPSNGTLRKRTSGNGGKLQKIDEKEVYNNGNSVKAVTAPKLDDLKVTPTPHQTPADHTRPPTVGYNSGELVEDFPLSVLSDEHSKTKGKLVKSTRNPIGVNKGETLRPMMRKSPSIDIPEAPNPFHDPESNLPDKERTSDPPINTKVPIETNKRALHNSSHSAKDIPFNSTTTSQKLDVYTSATSLEYIETQLKEVSTNKLQTMQRVKSTESNHAAKSPTQDINPTTSTTRHQELETEAAVLTEHIKHGIGNEISLERLKFETPIATQHEVNDAAIHTRALVILGQLINEDPSRKVVAFKASNEKYWEPLEKTHDIPQTMEGMHKYIADPQYNSKTKRLIFHVRFATAKPLRLMKRNPVFMEWLKREKIWLTVNQISTTDNRRVGFFIGKSCHITNLNSFYSFVLHQLSKTNMIVPDFQINPDGIGDPKDNTRSKALVIISASADVPTLCEQLLETFSLDSAFPFMPFKIMHNLSLDSQRTYYYRQKQETIGPDLVEISLPDFDDLDTPSDDPNSGTLREYVFSLTHGQHKLRADIDNGTRSQDVVIRVHRNQKEEVKQLIATWLQDKFNFHVVWPREHGANMFHMDAASKEATNKFEDAASAYTSQFPSLKESSSNPPFQPPPHTTQKTNQWSDLSKVKHNPPQDFTYDQQTVATSASTFTHSSKMQEDFQTLRQNIRKVALSHKRIEAVVLENFLNIEESEMNLAASFEAYRDRMNRLEIARQRQSAINFMHTSITLDPEQRSRVDLAKQLMHLVLQDVEAAKEDREIIQKVPPQYSLPKEAEKLRKEARRNKRHFSNLLAQSEIPPGEPLAFQDLTELELRSDDASEGHV